MLTSGKLSEGRDPLVVTTQQGGRTEVSTNVTDVPVRFEPRWREVPSLAWVAARAYSPTWVPGRPLAVLVAACSLLLWMPTAVTMRASRRLAALDRHALVEVAAIGSDRSAAARLRITGSAAACLVMLLLVMTTVGISVAAVALHAGLGGHAAMTVAMLVVAVPTLTAVAAAEPWRVSRSAPPLQRTIRALRAEGPGTPIWRLGALAAWPHGSGHGSALLTGLLHELPRGGYVVCYPRDRSVEAWYLRLGMQRRPADGALYLDVLSGRRGAMSEHG
jgi:hypothetical protein